MIVADRLLQLFCESQGRSLQSLTPRYRSFCRREFAGMKLPQKVISENGCDVDRRGTRRKYRYRICGSKSRPGGDVAGHDEAAKRQAARIVSSAESKF